MSDQNEEFKARMQDPSAELSDEEIDAILFRERMPGILMLRTRTPEEAGAPGCWFGGQPTLPPEIDWPHYHHIPTKEDPEIPEANIPMHFLVQINLDYVPHVLGLPSLPRTGTLFVFIESVAAPWTGYRGCNSPAPMVSGQGLRVIHVKEDVRQVPRRKVPEIPQNILYEGEQAGKASFDYWPFDFVVIDTYPPSQNNYGPTVCSNRILELEKKKNQELCAFLNINSDKIYKYSMHTIFGISQQINFRDADHLKKRGDHCPYSLTSDHIMLFRFESDRIGFSFVDGYPIGLWIKKQDLEKHNFDNVVAWEDLW